MMINKIPVIILTIFISFLLIFYHYGGKYLVEMFITIVVLCSFGILIVDEINKNPICRRCGREDCNRKGDKK